MKLQKLRLTLALCITVGGLIFTALYAWYYVVSALSGEIHDAYARNWQFQLIAFSIVRLPIILIVWFVLILLLLAVPWRVPHGSQ